MCVAAQVRTLEHAGRALLTVEAGLLGRHTGRHAWEGTGWWTKHYWDDAEVGRQELVALPAAALQSEYAGPLAFLDGLKRLGAPRYTMRTSVIDASDEVPDHVQRLVERALAGSTLRFLLAEDALERADGGVDGES